MVPSFYDDGSGAIFHTFSTDESKESEWQEQTTTPSSYLSVEGLFPPEALQPLSAPISPASDHRYRSAKHGRRRQRSTNDFSDGDAYSQECTLFFYYSVSISTDDETDLAQQFMISTDDTSDLLHPSLPPSLPKPPIMTSPPGTPQIPERTSSQRSLVGNSSSSFQTPRSKLSESLLNSSNPRIDEVVGNDKVTPFKWDMLQDLNAQDWTPPESWGVATHVEPEAGETMTPIEVSTQHNVEESAASRAAFTTGDMVIFFHC